MSSTAGRPAAMLLAALLLPVAVAGCGVAPERSAATPTAPASATVRCVGSTSTPAVPSYGASGFADTPGDAPPHYAENHAFQRRMSLCGEDLERVEKEAARAEAALADLAAVTPAEVARILGQLGHDPRETVVNEEGPQVHFAVMVAPACLDGLVGPDGARVEALGIYSEGGCVKPVGGH